MSSTSVVPGGTAHVVLVPRNAQEPLQPVKKLPVFAVAVRVTGPVCRNFPSQTPVQLTIPAGVLLIRPLVPVTSTTIRRAGANVTVTVRFAVIASVHAPLPVQPPRHPLTTPAAPAACSKLTEVPAGNGTPQESRWQSTPAGLLLTAPSPAT